MPRYEAWNPNLSRVELDQRARDARLRLERIEKLLIARLLAGAARARHQPRRTWLRPRGFRGYDAGEQGECPPPGMARPPSLGTRAADAPTQPAAPAWPDGVARPLPQAA